MGVSGLRIMMQNIYHQKIFLIFFKKFKDNLGGGDLHGDFTVYFEIKK